MPSILFDAPVSRALGHVTLRVVPIAACLLGLTACGSGGSAKSAPGVASLPSSSGASNSASGAAGATSAATGPQERLDDTPERRAQLVYAWDECLVAHGAQWLWNKADHPDAGPGKVGALKEPIPRSAYPPCENKLPQLPRELNPSLNPNYVKDIQDQVACMRAHGLHNARAVKDTSVFPNGLVAGTDNVTAASAKITDDCELQAFSDKKGK
ncbi:hypothetical protein ACFV2H_19855 [Streptomyces sp. NPDC059629]|uniref:hypothetical protein n=1 Tax=Streptomyces sp. NPDC059629 TaxID=3346889 RepID=UPI0036B8D84B